MILDLGFIPQKSAIPSELAHETARGRRRQNTFPFLQVRYRIFLSIFFSIFQIFIHTYINIFDFFILFFNFNSIDIN